MSSIAEMQTEIAELQLKIDELKAKIEAIQLAERNDAVAEIKRLMELKGIKAEELQSTSTVIKFRKSKPVSNKKLPPNVEFKNDDTGEVYKTGVRGKPPNWAKPMIERFIAATNAIQL